MNKKGAYMSNYCGQEVQKKHCSIALIVFSLIFIFIIGETVFSRRFEKEQTEQKLRGIIEGERCYVFETATVSWQDGTQTLSRVQCAKSGIHEVSLGDLPRNFVKQNGAIQPISPLD